MNIRYPILSLITLLPMLLIGCSDRAGTTDAHEGVHMQEGPTGPTNRVEIPAVVRRNLGVTFATVERRHVSRTLRVPGRFELLPTAKREYRMTMPGHVELLVDQYQRVEAGQPLFRFRSVQWAVLQSELVAAEQAVLLAESELHVAATSVVEMRRRLEIQQSRVAALAAADVRMADVEYQVAELEASLERGVAERGLAEARLRAARQSLEQAIVRTATALNVERTSPLLSGTIEDRMRSGTPDAITVHAVVNGVVESMAITDGAYVDDGLLVMTVVDPNRVRFRGVVSQGELGRISTGAPAQVVPPQSHGYSPSEHVDVDLALSLETSPNQRTIELVALPHEHRTWMRPGVSAFLEITLEGTDRPELAIPRSALMRDGLNHVFFRRDPSDPNAAIRVEADLGPDDGRWVVIRSDLRLGDEVVLDGAYELMLATSQSGGAMKGGHFHPDGTWHADH